MKIESIRLEEYKSGEKTIKKLFEQRREVRIIHYSCELFNGSNSHSPRITSIAIRDFDNAQTITFSLYQESLYAKNLINEVNLDSYEKLLLDKYFEYIEKNRSCNWVHWNMRDSNYGFEAIADRYRILGGIPIFLDNDRMIDLSRLLNKMYTSKYEEHGSCGKFLNLAKNNNITIKDALKGTEESEFFKQGRYSDLKLSNLRKVDIMETILDMVYKKELKVKVSDRQIYGITLKGIHEVIKNNSYLLLFFNIIMMVLGAILQSFIGNILK